MTLLQEVVKKIGNKWCVVSHTTGRKLGCYNTEAEAKRRLKQIQFFKHRESTGYLISTLAEAVEVTDKYIRIRQTDPDKYIRFRIKVLNAKEGIKAVIGFKQGGGSEVQSYLFDKNKWTRERAKTWVAKH